MILYLFIVGIASASAQDITSNTTTDSPSCSFCIFINTTCYSVSYMLNLNATFRTEVVIPKMVLLRSSNTLFYSFEPLFEDEEYYKTGFVKLEGDSSTHVINSGQIFNFGTFDIDQDNDLIYIGGSDGIYVIDAKTNKMLSYSSRGDTITNIFFKNFVYFTKYNEKGIVVKNGDYFRTYYEDVYVKNFIVTKYDVFVILSNTGLYVGKGDAMHKISSNVFIRGITMDLDGNIYAWWIDELYKVVLGSKLKYSELVKVAEIPIIGALAFDNRNNILFTLDKSLYVMKKTNSNCSIIPVNDE